MMALAKGADAMAEERVERRLTAILAADVAGYSRLGCSGSGWSSNSVRRGRSSVRARARPNSCSILTRSGASVGVQRHG